MQVFSDHPVMAPEEYCSIYSAENYTQQVQYLIFAKAANCFVDFVREKAATNLCTSGAGFSNFKLLAIILNSY
jgi:hypothetical protein